MAQQKKIQMDIIADMTRQFKSVEEDLTNRINGLENRKSDNELEIDRLRKQHEELKADIDKDVDSKGKVIESLKTRIDELSSDFAKMLTETLDNMKRKISDANSKWQNENEGTQAMMQ